MYHDLLGKRLINRLFVDLLKLVVKCFAIDWIEHPLSDKSLQASLLSLELHMQTISKVFDHYQSETAVVTHDWGAGTSR